MASFDWFYVQAKRGEEEQLLARLRPVVEKLGGRYIARVRRGSGWVQLDEQPEPEPADGGDFDLSAFLEQMQGMVDAAAQAVPAERRVACDISKALGVDVVFVRAVTSVDAVEFVRCRAGKVTRAFQYCPQDEESNGWSEDQGKPESWEKEWPKPRSIERGPGPTDIGQSLGLPGLEASYFLQGFSFDVQVELSGGAAPRGKPAKKGRAKAQQKAKAPAKAAKKAPKKKPLAKKPKPARKVANKPRLPAKKPKKSKKKLPAKKSKPSSRPKKPAPKKASKAKRAKARKR